MNRQERETTGFTGFDNFWRERLKDYVYTEEFRQLFEELKEGLPTPDRKLKVPVVISMIGIPGSGKSTFSKLLQEFTPALQLRSDVIGLFRLSRGPDYDYYKAYVIQEALARYYLVQGYSVIMDDNNRTLYNREQVYRMAHHHGAQNILFHLDISIDEAVRRTQKRDFEEGRSIELRPGVEVVQALEMFQGQIEEPTEEELENFKVIYRRIPTDLPTEQIKAVIESDEALQKVINPEYQVH